MADPVLVLRPEPGATRTAEALREADFTPILYPLYGIEQMDWRPPDPADVDALLITSANAVRHGGPGLARYLSMPVYTVGEATARVARQAGFAAVETGGGDAATTIPLIVRAGHRRILHLGGVEVRDFDPLGLSLHRIPVYRTVPCGDAGGVMRAMPQEQGVYAFVHSARAAERFGSLIAPEHRSRITIIAISNAASEACGTGWRDRVVAGAPNDAAMLAGLQMLV